MPKHADLAVPNLEVMNLMKSMKSRGFVTEQFSWQHHYYFLTDEGINFLRTYLHLPESVVPNTIAKASARSGTRRTIFECFGSSNIFLVEEGEKRERRQEGGEYRRGGWRGEAKVAA